MRLVSLIVYKCLVRSLVRFSSSATTRVGPILQSRSEIIGLLLKPTWSLSKATHLDVECEIDSKVLYKVLALSGLSSDITEGQEKRMLDALRIQMSFILALYKDGDTHATTNTDAADSHFRLLACDHVPDAPHTLESLLKDIEGIALQRDPEKGELGFDALLLTSDSQYFEINGLIKR